MPVVEKTGGQIPSAMVVIYIVITAEGQGIHVYALTQLLTIGKPIRQLPRYAIWYYFPHSKWMHPRWKRSPLNKAPRPEARKNAVNNTSVSDQ